MDITDARGRKTAWLEFLPLVVNDVDGVSRVKIPVPGRAFVTVDLPVVPTRREIPEVAVRALLSVAPFNRVANEFSFDPPSVTVTVEGSQATVDRFAAADIVVYADQRGNVSTGKPDEFRVRLRAVSRDPAMEAAVVRIEPETVTWIVGPPRPAAIADGTQEQP
jgi:copper chaperone CopZ